MKLTENKTINYLIKHLKKDGWEICKDDVCYGQKKGIDIKATKSGKTLIIEVKGAVADEKSPTSKNKEKFNSSQIKTHFGMAIVKMLIEKDKNPNYLLAIAHPDDKDIRNGIEKLTPYLSKLDIKHFWVSEEKIIEEN